MTIDDIPDAVLANLIRTGTYSRNTRFGEGENDARHLLVLAVPYGPIDEVQTLEGAFRAFFELVQAADYEERNIQVLSIGPANVPVVEELALENIKDVYEVVVGNIGSVYEGPDAATARRHYTEYVEQSKAGYGRAANESVYLMQDGEPIEEHQGVADDEDED